MEVCNTDFNTPIEVRYIEIFGGKVYYRKPRSISIKEL